MKNTAVLCFALSLASMAHAKNPLKVIYGDDNRVDVYASTIPDYVNLSRSTAAMIDPIKLKADSKTGLVRVLGQTLAARGVCHGERFSKQISAANCSGFLIGEKTLVTAGHCIQDEADCRGNRWVFDFKVETENQGIVKVPAESVYSCAKIITRSLDAVNKNDFAMIELDRPVTDRAPLKIRQEGKPSIGDSLVVIGHPTGLPTKIADGAAVRSNKGKFFVANLDTFGGNSGSAVFNTQTLEVEGILVRGENDYVYDGQQGCEVANRCENDECRGEDVTYILNIPGVRNVQK